MQSTSNHTWHKIAGSVKEIRFSDSGLAELEVNGKRICLGLHQDKIFACTKNCPHAGGILADGYIDAAGNLVCPLHRYRFNPQNGRNTSGEGYFLKIFQLEFREDGVYICLGEEKLF